MVYRLASLFLLSLAGQASAKAINVKRTDSTRVISSSFTDKSFSADLGDFGDKIIINSGVQVWLSGHGDHDLQGNLDNSGTLVFSQTDSTFSTPSGLDSHWHGSSSSSGNLNNRAGALILLNDASASSSAIYDWDINSFQNDGTIHWCGRGDHSIMKLITDESSVNSGLIVFEQTSGSGGTATWRSEDLSNDLDDQLTNNGGFLLRHITVELKHNFLGSGCFIIGDEANLVLDDGVFVYKNPTRGPALLGQSISFTGRSGTLNFDYLHGKNPDFGAKIYGFGQGNSIEFHQTISTLSYSGSILRVNFIGGDYFNLNIGSGYNAGGFSKGPSGYHSFHNAVLYSGAPPAASVPAQCLLTAPVCAPLTPGSNPNPPPPATTKAATTSIQVPVSTTTSVAAVPTTSLVAPVPTTSSLIPVAPTTSLVAPVPTTSSLVPVAPTTSLIAPVPTTTALPPVAPTTSSVVIPVPTTTSLVPVAPTTSKAAASTTSSAAGPNISPLGCYRDTAQFSGPRTLNGPSYTDMSGMTNQACAAFCTRQGFPVSGTEYGIECFCGSALPTSGPATCDKACSGDASSICGGDWALTISINKDLPAPSAPAAPTTTSAAGVPTTSTIAPVPTTSAVVTVPTTSQAASTTSSAAGPDISPLGCYRDTAQFGGPRTLNGPSYVDRSGLTNQACAAYCTRQGFPVSGTEYGIECYCGSALPTSGPATCDKACSGDASSICGGDWALTISINKDLPAPSAPASSTVVAVPTTVPVVPTSTLASTTSAVATPTKEPFKYDGKPVGCFADAAETGAARTFAGSSYKDFSLTNEKCANFCGDRGFIYSGTEFGEECFCSNTAPTVTSDKCTVKCSGDASEICGGPWTLTVTANQDIIDARNDGLPPSPPYNELGCFADSPAARTFTGFSYKDDSMTPAMCAAKCSSLSFAFSGTEFGNECYCSNVAPVTTSTQCNKSCAGNSKLICGGPDALTVYQDLTLPVSTAPPTCPGLPAGYAVCADGQRVSGGKCFPL